MIALAPRTAAADSAAASHSSTGSAPPPRYGAGGYSPRRSSCHPSPLPAAIVTAADRHQRPLLLHGRDLLRERQRHGVRVAERVGPGDRHHRLRAASPPLPAPVGNLVARPRGGGRLRSNDGRRHGPRERQRHLGSRRLSCHPSVAAAAIEIAADRHQRPLLLHGRHALRERQRQGVGIAGPVAPPLRRSLRRAGISRSAWAGGRLRADDGCQIPLCSATSQRRHPLRQRQRQGRPSSAGGSNSAIVVSGQESQRRSTVRDSPVRLHDLRYSEPSRVSAE